MREGPALPIFPRGRLGPKKALNAIKLCLKKYVTMPGLFAQRKHSFYHRSPTYDIILRASRFFETIQLTISFLSAGFELICPKYKLFRGLCFIQMLLQYQPILSFNKLFLTSINFSYLVPWNFFLNKKSVSFKNNRAISIFHVSRKKL